MKKRNALPKNTQDGKGKSDKKEMLLRLLLNTVLLLVLYYLCIRVNFEYIFHIYVAAGVLLGVVYFVYNRGFSAKGVTPEMLPDTMPMSEKLAFIEDGKKRLHDSRWMLTILLPIILTVAVDTFYVLVLQELFK